MCTIRPHVWLHMQETLTYPVCTHACDTHDMCVLLNFLNQERASLWPARAWFNEIEPVRIISVCVCVCVCVCVFAYVSAPKAINN